VSVDAGFLHDLEQCARRVYELRDNLAQWRSRQRVDRIFDHDRRVVIGLASQLLVSIALIPWLGPGVVLAGLAVLYVGAVVTTAWTLRRIRRADASGRTESIELAVRRALATCPPLTSGAMALMIRLANLAAIPPTVRSVALLQATLREAEAHPDLQGWPFLDDVAALVDGSLGQPIAMAASR
jgi:hypothetical protein